VLSTTMMIHGNGTTTSNKNIYHMQNESLKAY
jgi:hypothetical protein